MMITTNPPSLTHARTQAAEATDPDDKALLEAAIVLGEANMLVFDQPHSTHTTATADTGTEPDNALEYPVVALAGQARLRDDSTLTWVKQQLEAVLARLGSSYRSQTAVCALASGTEQVAGRAALDLGMRLWAYTAPDGPADLDGADTVRWHRLTRRADRVEPMPHTTCQARIVADCDALVAIWDGSRGDVYDLVGAARAAGLPVVRIDPATRELSSRGQW